MQPLSMSLHRKRQRLEDSVAFCCLPRVNKEELDFEFSNLNEQYVTWLQSYHMLHTFQLPLDLLNAFIDWEQWGKCGRWNEAFSHCPFYYCGIKKKGSKRLRYMYLLMRIARRFEVKYSYLSLGSPVQDSFAILTLQHGPRGSFNRLMDWLPSEGTFKSDNEASMPPFRRHCARLYMSAFLESKRQKSSVAS